VAFDAEPDSVDSLLIPRGYHAPKRAKWSIGIALKIDYSMRLPDGEFFPAARKKTGIAIHHTVGLCLGSASAGFLIGTLIQH